MASVQGQSVNQYARRPGLIGVLLIVSVAALILLAIWGASLLPPPLRYAIWIGIALIPAIIRFSQPCAYLFRKSRTGAILLNLGYVDKLSGRLIAVSMLLVIGWFFLWILSPSRAPMVVILQFSLVVSFIVDATVKFIASCEPTLITEKGIYWPEGMALWNKIESHQWFKLREEVLLVLKLKGKPWPLEEKKLRVPASRMADVDKILREGI